MTKKATYHFYRNYTYKGKEVREEHANEPDAKHQTRFVLQNSEGGSYIRYKLD